MENETEKQMPVGSDALVVPLRVLRLTLKRQWFDMIASGEKREEYREQGKWIDSRVNANKEYDVVEFKNGYGPDVPCCVVEYRGYDWATGNPAWGAVPGKLYKVLRLGRVVSLHADVEPPSERKANAMIKRCQNCEAWNNDTRRECWKCYLRLGSLSPSDAAACSAVLARIEGMDVRKVMASTQYGMGFLIVTEGAKHLLNGIAYRNDAMPHAERVQLAHDVNQILRQNV